MWKFYLLWTASLSLVSGQCLIPSRDNGYINCASSEGVRSCITICFPGFNIHGPYKSTCDPATGEWDNNFAFCLMCPPLSSPKFSSHSWFRSDDGDVSVSFECPGWMTLIGPNRLTCAMQSQEWDPPSSRPICLPDFSKCTKGGSSRCPRVRTKIYKEFLSHNHLLSDVIKQEIANLTQQLDSVLVDLRGSSRCFSAMCRVPCLFFPRKKWMRRCVNCKKNRIITCSRYGTVFS